MGAKCPNLKFFMYGCPWLGLTQAQKKNYNSIDTRLQDLILSKTHNIKFMTQEELTESLDLGHASPRKH